MTGGPLQPAGCGSIMQNSYCSWSWHKTVWITSTKDDCCREGCQGGSRRCLRWPPALNCRPSTACCGSTAVRLPAAAALLQSIYRLLRLYFSPSSGCCGSTAVRLPAAAALLQSVYRLLRLYCSPSTGCCGSTAVCLAAAAGLQPS